MTGKELAALRRAARMTQADLARRAGIGRHAVSYWECKSRVDRQAWAVSRIAGVLALPDDASPERACAAMTDSPWRKAAARAEAAAIAAMEQRRQVRLATANARRRVRCRARTRKGTPCRCKSEPGKARCKFHGGLSTGARTPEGRARIAEAQRRRWARWRAARGIAEPEKT